MSKEMRGGKTRCKFKIRDKILLDRNRNISQYNPAWPDDRVFISSLLSSLSLSASLFPCSRLSLARREHYPIIASRMGPGSLTRRDTPIYRRRNFIRMPVFTESHKTISIFRTALVFLSIRRTATLMTIRVDLAFRPDGNASASVTRYHR